MFVRRGFQCLYSVLLCFTTSLSLAIKLLCFDFVGLLAVVKSVCTSTGVFGMDVESDLTTPLLM